MGIYTDYTFISQMVTELHAVASDLEVFEKTMERERNDPKYQKMLWEKMLRYLDRVERVTDVNRKHIERIMKGT